MSTGARPTHDDAPLLDPELRDDVRLAAEGVVAGYPGAEPVLRGADLTITAGRRVALLGANGSGKTTILRCLAGSHQPSAGRVLVDGAVLRHDRSGLRRHRQRVQLVLQDPDDQLFSADVTQDVSFGPMNLGLGVDEVRERVDEALDLLGITHLAERPTHQLSFGERKRAATAGAVAMRPAVLLLDEPTAGLDPVGVEEMLAALTRLEDHGTTVLLATHDVDLALAWAHEAAVVQGGTLVQGPADQVLTDADLVASARLRRPWVLDVQAALHGRGLLTAGTRPRDLDTLLGALAPPQTGPPPQTGTPPLTTPALTSPPLTTPRPS